MIAQPMKEASNSFVTGADRVGVAKQTLTSQQGISVLSKP